MNLEAYRIFKTKYASTAFSGEGARLYGGRWNSVGTRMVYLASSLSLGTLELFVHTEDYATIYDLCSYIRVEVPEKLIKKVESDDLPLGWDSPEPCSDTQIFGDAWIKASNSAVLSVPSAVTKTESNLLVNPDHPDFKKLKLGLVRSFDLDSRLLGDDKK